MLRDEGATRHDIERALATGEARRVRRGWYAVGIVDPLVEHAVACGGTVTCSGALRRHGIWVLRASEHVRIDGHARQHRAHRTRVHRLSGSARDGVDDPMTALVVAATCLTHEELVCAIDSAMNRGVIGELPPSQPDRRLVRAIAAHDPRSESGIETLARLRLIAAGIRPRLQVTIHGVGRVDLLIGDRLVVELDGDEWHSTAEARERDRRRDSALTALGYLRIRAGYHRVVSEWPQVLAEILAVVRRHEHKWGARRRREHSVG
ncbi:type IV toxin-antitoxin system AbiEi family antitoxin domain-containing protein [Schumannella luteola]|nr:DUF559 domain-containing protein [Schumannella luteola]